MTMKIADITFDRNRVSANIDGFELWYTLSGEIPSAAFPDLGSALLCAALLPAMRRRRSLRIDSPISSELLRNTDELQKVFSRWYGLSAIPIEAQAIPSRPVVEGGVGCFFSGGVDSIYSFLSNRKLITHLLTIRGADMEVDSRLWPEVLAANQRFAGDFGVKLIAVETNARRFITAFGSNWPEAHGGVLAGIAHLVGFGRTIIASSHSEDDDFPWGSHKDTDHLWSTESSRLVHDGAIRRNEKIRLIGQTPNSLSGLRVCWQDKTYNCGTCEKCLRTRISLRLLGLESDSLKPLESIDELKSYRIGNESELAYFLDNLHLAETVGDLELAESLRIKIRAWERWRKVRKCGSSFVQGVRGRARRVLERVGVR